MKKEYTILLVDDDRFYSELVKNKLEKALIGRVKICSTPISCLNNLHLNPDLIILDHNFQQNTNGLDLLKEIKEVSPKIPVIYLSSQDKVKIAIKSLRLGAIDYIEKSIGNLEYLKLSVLKALNQNRIRYSNKSFNKNIKVFLSVMALMLITVALFKIYAPRLFNV